MKLALRMIPTEVWVDVFCYPWITRKKLAKIVDKFRNRYFAEILQYCLHERGKRTLGTWHLDIETFFGSRTLPNIPQTPLPENIKFFKQLIICHFKFQTLDFLRRISPLFNANQVNLSFSCWSQRNLAKYRAVLDHLAPMLHGIHSLGFDQAAIPLVEQYFAQKLDQVKMLTIHVFDPNEYQDQEAIDFCLNWLTSGERDPAEPRFLKVYGGKELTELFSEAIKQQFLSAKSLRTFAIEFQRYWLAPDTFNMLNDFHLENSIGEQLHGQKANQSATFQILRHQPNAGAALQEWVKATVEKSGKSSVIRIGSPDELTFGRIDADGGDSESPMFMPHGME